MSEPQSALPGASASGFVETADAGPVGMVTVRGDLADAAIRNAIAGCLIAALPDARKLVTNETDTLLWMSPDELLLVCPHDEAEAHVAALLQALNGLHHLVVNVSDARAVFTLTGKSGALREVLAKLAPADLRHASLPVGEVRRTRLAQVPAAIWFDDETHAKVVCFRSVADYVFGLLKVSAAPGSEVEYFD